MKDNMSEGILFFSQKCQHCHEALNLIEKIGKDKFIFRNVDVPNIPIPPQVDRVPCLATNDRKLYMEETLFSFLKSKMQSDIQPFMINEMGSGLSDNYSYMDESGANLDHSFQFLNKDFRINTTTNEDDNKRIVNYEQFLAERDNDLKLLTGK